MSERNLTDDERWVLCYLSAAWASWCHLGERHPDDDTEFRQAIHALQNLVAFRVARRVDPDVWHSPTAGKPRGDGGAAGPPY